MGRNYKSRQKQEKKRKKGRGENVEQAGTKTRTSSEEAIDDETKTLNRALNRLLINSKLILTKKNKE